MLIELFSLGVTAESLRAKSRSKIGDFAPMESLWSNISGRRFRPTNHFSSQKTRLMLRVV